MKIAFKSAAALTITLAINNSTFSMQLLKKAVAKRTVKSLKSPLHHKKNIHLPHLFSYCTSTNKSSVNTQTILSTEMLTSLKRSTRFSKKSLTDITKIRGNHKRVISVAFSPDNKYLFSVSGNSTIKQWNLKTFECIRTLQEDDNFICCASFSPDGNYVALGDGNMIKLWCLKTYQCIATLQGDASPVWSVAFSESKPYLASGSSDKTIKNMAETFYFLGR